MRCSTALMSTSHTSSPRADSWGWESRPLIALARHAALHDHNGDRRRVQIELNFEIVGLDASLTLEFGQVVS
jgi:hypothetical protein